MNSEQPTLTVQNGTILYSVNGRVAWEFPLPDVRLVAEFTTDDAFSEHHILIATSKVMRQVQIGPNNLDEFWAPISQALGISIGPTLFYATDFRSSVLFPSRLAGKPVWVPIRQHGWWNKLRNLYQTQYELNPEVRKELAD